MERLPDDLAHAYLDLLGVEVAPGAIDAVALRGLQRTHVARVPFETIDIVRGAPPGIDPVASARRIVGGRGGYCFHLNGAFSALLAWLGVDVTRHLAGVQRRGVAEPRGPDGNHLGLTARTPDGAVWLVDVGLGDGPAEPLPLVTGPHEQDGYHYRLGPSSAPGAAWRFEHDARGGFAGFDVAAESAAMPDFEAMHAQLSTESKFTRVATAQRRVANRVEILRGCVYAEIDPVRTRTRDVTGADDWWELVTGHFGLAYGDLDGAERNVLWRRVREGHESWVAAGRP